MASKLLEREFTTDNGIKIEVLAWKIPESEEFPEGVKYKFQAYDPEDEETVLRNDNHNEHSNSRHHKHIGADETAPIDFENLETLYRKFVEEVKKLERKT